MTQTVAADRGKSAHYVAVRGAWLVAIAQQSQAKVCEEGVRPGEAIARLRLAAAELGTAHAVAKKQLAKTVVTRLALLQAEEADPCCAIPPIMDEP